MKKKRSKKYNPIKTLITNNERILKGYAVAYVYSPFKEKQMLKILVNMRGDVIPVTQIMSDALTKVRYKWSVYISTFGHDSNGEAYHKSEELFFKDRYLQEELVHQLNDRHGKQTKNFNENHYCGAGWIASPTGNDFTEEHAFKIFEILGGFDITQAQHFENMQIKELKKQMEKV